MSKPYYEPLDKDGYKHHHNRNFFDGWKIHFQPNEEITEQELDSFFSRHEVAQWKTAKPGSEDSGTGKQITAYTGDRDKTMKIVDDLNSKFGDKLITDSLPRDEESLGKVTARFNIGADLQSRYHQYGQGGVSFTNEDAWRISVLERWNKDQPELAVRLRHSAALKVEKEMQQQHGTYFTGTGSRAFKIEENISDQMAKLKTSSASTTKVSDPIATVTGDPSSVVAKANEPIKAPTKKYEVKRRSPGTTVSQPTTTPVVPPVISQPTTVAAITPPVSSTSTSPPVIKPPHRPVDPLTMARDEAGYMDIITEGAPYAKRKPVARRGRMDEEFLPTTIPRQPDPFRETPITEGIPKKTPSLMSRLPMKSIGGAIGGAIVGRFFAGDEEGQKTAGTFMGAASGAGFTSVIENYYKSQNSSIQANYLSTVKGMDARFKSEQQYMAKLEATPINDPRNFSPYREWREATDWQLGVSAANTLGPVAPEITTALAIIPNRETATLSKEAAMGIRRDAQAVRRTARTNNKMVTAGLAAAAVVATAGIGLSFSGGDKSSGINSKRGL